jgi:hypothetical protein
MRLLLLTGPGGDAQGWGDMGVTESVREAAESSGYSTRIADVETEAEFFRRLDAADFDIVWSALYHITSNERFIGSNEGGLWVADVFDARGIPYIGSNSQTMKDMIDKFHTHDVLARHGVPVPAHHLVRVGDEDVSRIRYPAFVKPMGESAVGRRDRRQRGLERRRAAPAGGVRRPRVPSACARRGLPAGRRVHRADCRQRRASGVPARPRVGGGAALRQAQGAAGRPAWRRADAHRRRGAPRGRGERARLTGGRTRWAASTTCAST